MKEIILNFPKQLTTELETYYLDKINYPIDYFLLVGMGGSHLAGDILKNLKPSLNLGIHSDYQLPQNLKTNSLIIIASYSGNTAETLNALTEAEDKNYPLVVITTGGQLWTEAENKNLPRIKIPGTGIPPRMALGYFLNSLALITKDNDLANQLSRITLTPDQLEENGQDLADSLSGLVPLCYASASNSSLALNWKIKLNETGKTPAFWNVFPEMNHNEIESLNTWPDNFIAILIKDENDDDKIKSRMTVFLELLKNHHKKYLLVELDGQSRLIKFLNNLILADWVSYYLAQKQNLDPAQTPIIEEFKKLIN